MTHYFHFEMFPHEHEAAFLLIREYCERNKRVLKFYRPLEPKGSWICECWIDGGSREELLEFFRDHKLDRFSKNSEKQL